MPSAIISERIRSFETRVGVAELLPGAASTPRARAGASRRTRDPRSRTGGRRAARARDRAGRPPRSGTASRCRRATRRRPRARSATSNSAERGTPDSSGCRITGSGVSGGRRSPQIASSSRVAHSSRSRSAAPPARHQTRRREGGDGRRDQERALVLAEDRAEHGLRARRARARPRSALGREQAVVALTGRVQRCAAPRPRLRDRGGGRAERGCAEFHDDSTAGAPRSATWKRTPCASRAQPRKQLPTARSRTPLALLPSSRLRRRGREKPRRCCDRVAVARSVTKRTLGVRVVPGPCQVRHQVL